MQLFPLPTSFWPYVFKTTSRARIRSALTVLGLVVGMSLFGFVRSMDAGLTRLESSMRDNRALLVFERNTF